jgi:peptide/nickel transport system substrate-binding protein
MIMQFDGAKAESKRYDESLTPDYDALMTHFKGVRITSTDPLTIETYDDLFALDAENNITSWYPSYYYGFQGGMINMQSLVGAMLAEENGELALSSSKSTDKQVEYTSLIAGPSLEVQKTWLDQAIADQYIPFAPTMSEFITAEEAVQRYNNMVAWYEAHNHLFIGTGPYFVDQVFPVEGTITLKRYEDYIFPANEFSVFAEPKLAAVAIDGPTTVVAGEEAAFDLTVTANDEPYPTAELASVSYILFNADGTQAGTGEAEAVADGQWQIVLPADVTSTLQDGTAKLSVVVSSNIVSIPTFTTYEFVVTQ